MSAKPYKCRHPGCGKVFKHKSKRDRHEQNVHGPPQYKGPHPDCNKLFKWKESLTHHLKYSHNFDDSSRIPCLYPKCGKSFKNKKSLNAHIRDTHSDVISLYRCPYPYCSKTFIRKYNLNEHIRLFHQGQRPHACGNCNATYKRLADLRNHLQKNLCWSPRLTDNRRVLISEHDYTVLQLQNFLVETKELKFIQSELYLPNGCRLDLFVQCPDDRCVGFDVTIGRSNPANLRYQIVSKFHKEYEEICDIVYIVTLAKIKHAHRTIHKCDQSKLKPKNIRVVHWSAIIDDPKYIRIFQQIEDGTALSLRNRVQES